MRTIRTLILFPLLFIVVVACTREEHDADARTDNAVFSTDQKKLAGIKTASLAPRMISPVVSCTGEVEVPPQGIASVTAPLGGFIAATEMVAGTFVKKGAQLARISNPEYIVLQQSYMETSGQLQFAEQEYRRQKMLDERDATAVKKLQESESNYRVLGARLAGLKEQLKMIGINLNELEHGKIQSEVVLRAPLTGFVTAVNHHPGQYVEPREVIFQIVNMNELHLHLNVFEKDITRVRNGQIIRFRAAGDRNTSWRGKVLLVSPQRNESLRTFDVHGHIDDETNRLKPGMFVEAEILTGSDSVDALPAQALVKDGDNTFVVSEESGSYKVNAVETGTELDGWVEIRNAGGLRNRKIVTEGATRVFAALKKGVKPEL